MLDDSKATTLASKAVFTSPKAFSAKASLSSTVFKFVASAAESSAFAVAKAASTFSTAAVNVAKFAWSWATKFDTSPSIFSNLLEDSAFAASKAAFVSLKLFSKHLIFEKFRSLNFQFC